MYKLCPLCEHGNLNTVVYTETIWVNNNPTNPVVVYGLIGDNCDYCDEIVISPEQSIINDDSVNDAITKNTANLKEKNNDID